MRLQWTPTDFTLPNVKQIRLLVTTMESRFDDCNLVECIGHVCEAVLKRCIMIVDDGLRACFVSYYHQLSQACKIINFRLAESRKRV